MSNRPSDHPHISSSPNLPTNDSVARQPVTHAARTPGPDFDNAGFAECQFDSLVGPTHNYAGLAYGNVASERNRAQASNPKLAAQQGLEKMWQVASLGVPQAILPPLVRPQIAWLRNLGFAGSIAEVIRQSALTDPALLAAAYSASSMWAANAATVSPSPDTADRRVHFTPANLTSSLHRSLESHDMAPILQAIFADDLHFYVHSPLPAAVALADEGAANHTRLAPTFSAPGIELFVYGRNALNHTAKQPLRFPARQTLQASQAIARRHGLANERTLFVQQHPLAIDAGVFHNDVISVGHLGLLLVHEQAFLDQPQVLERLHAQYEQLFNQPLVVAEIPNASLSLADAVQSYLFNSQLVNTTNGRTMLVCPQECEVVPNARATIDRLLAGEFTSGKPPIDSVKFLDLRQSMNNGGGPACLRLRVLLSQTERDAVRGRVWLDRGLYEDLKSWIDQHYRDRLEPSDLTDPALAEQAFAALQDLEQIIELPVGPTNQAW
ncbi:MAG: N-succinylarginine dihydrolase [Planctomycetaceae bacterium]|nr:N-succinylarginine dihydrolase [Planctomycetaceae bacterium]